MDMDDLPAASPGWILWAGTVGFESSLSERFAAAVATGCKRVSLSPPDVVRAASAGVAAAHIGSQARDLGLELVMDPVMNWYPHDPMPRSRFARISADDALRSCEELGVAALTVIAAPSPEVPVDALAERFAVVCGRAAAFGAEVQLEFMPFTVVPSLRIAWEVVRTADRTNGGLLFDTWHFFRGDPDFDVLATVPGDRIFCVQLDDAPAVPEADLRAETNRRLLPGDGELDLRRAVRALNRIGALRWVGPEVLSPELAALPVHQSAALAVHRCKGLLAAALEPA